MLAKIFEVFTKQYKEETKYREFLKSKLNSFKLENNDEDAEYKLQTLINSNFVSNFKI